MKQNMEDRWLVILNPNAGGQQAQSDWPGIEAELLAQGFEFEMVKTKQRLHAIELVAECIEKGFRKIIAVGGDGTLHEIANGIMQQTAVEPNQLVLGMISVGTGNDWIKTHHISSDFRTAIQQIKAGQTVVQDVGRITFRDENQLPQSRFFINSVGIGFDARVVKYIQPKKEKGKHGKGVYMNGLINSLFKNKNIASLLHFDNERVETHLYNLTIGLGRYKGGGFKMLPYAIPNDGKLDITIACKISKRKLIASLPKIVSGNVHRIKYFDFYKVEDLQLDISAPICTEADGEFLGHYPLQVSILPHQLRLISSFH